MGTYRAQIGAQFHYQKDTTIDGCLGCSVPVEECTGGEGKCPPGCQFYVAPKPDGRRQQRPRWQAVIAQLAAERAQ